MTNDQIKQALISKAPVRHNGIKYLRVCEIVYRCPANQILVSAGLMDKNGNSIVYAPVEKVEAIADDP